MGDLQGYLEQQQHQKKLEQQRLEKEMLEKERLNQIKNKGKDEESMSDLWFTPYIPTGWCIAVYALSLALVSLVA